MNKTESEYALILEAERRRGEISFYKFEGIRFSWGYDPQTGKPMYYKADFAVFGGIFPRIIEVKGSHIWPRDLVRFKGCRAEWGMYFQFEMHQKTKDGWKRLL